MPRPSRPGMSLILSTMLAGLATAQQPPPPPAPPPPVTAPAQPPRPAAAPTTAAAPAAPAAAAPQVAAMVNGQPLPQHAMQRALRSVPKDKQPEMAREVLNFLIDNMLIEQYLIAQKVDVTPKEIETRFTEVKQELTKQKLEYAKFLTEMMLTEPELLQTIAAELRWQKFVDGQGNEKALREMFAQGPDMFNGSLVRARHILLTPPSNDPKAVAQARMQLLGIRKQIEDSVTAGLAKLPQGKEAFARETERAKLIDDAFAEQARQHSMCPSKAQGGDVDWFPRAGGMVEPFAKAAYALKPFEMSDVVQTQFGLHLILPIDRKNGKPDVKFEEVKDDVRDVFAARLRENLCTELRAKAKIEMK